MYGSIVGFGPEAPAVAVLNIDPSEDNLVDDSAAIVVIRACRICRKFCEINYGESGLGSVIYREEVVVCAKIEVNV